LSKGIGFWILIALGILFALFIAFSLVTAADRLDVFGQQGRRAGYGTMDPGAGRLQFGCASREFSDFFDSIDASEECCYVCG
jgi:hypothetical protein